MFPFLRSCPAERVTFLSLSCHIFGDIPSFYGSKSFTPAGQRNNMPSLRFFLLVALLATIALAHPSPARRKLVARSFKVPRSLNPDHPTGLNGGDAMAKAYRKFGWGLIGARHRGGKSRKPMASTNTTTPTTTTPNTTQAETGEVTATPEQNASLFLSPVTIGGQTLNMDFDTGSSDL